MMHRRLLALVAAAYVVLASLYSVVTPVFEASDELWHYPMVKYIVDNGFTLPSPDPNQPWRQEGGQPPLYYLIAAALTAGIDTSDMDYVRRVNPHADIGIVRPDRNANMMAHRAEAEAFPWRSTTLAVHLIRFFSILLGLGTVLVTYALTREIVPEWPLVAVGAAALNAFLPMFLFISGSVNNDNLSNLLGNLLTLLIVRLVKATNAPRWRDYVVLGVVAGTGLLSKLNIGFLIPLVALALLVVSVRLRDWRPLVFGAGIAGLLTILIAGWWYLRNAQLYGDPTGLNVFLLTVGRRLIPANAAQLWAERTSFTQAYWGFFGGVNVPMPDVIYFAFNIVGGLALLSAVVFLVVILIRRQWSLDRWLPALVVILWPLLIFVSFLRWTAETPASQGRLVFGALSSISLWMAVGLAWWLPQRAKPALLALVAGFFFIVATLVPFTVIAPAYALPPAIDATGREAIATFTEPGDDGRVIQLLSGEVESEIAHPGEFVHLNLQWSAPNPLSRNWSMFIHLTTLEGVIISQRDVYPGGGTLATSDFSEPFAWDNPVSILVPRTAYAPTRLNVNVGWYDLASGERMTLGDGSDVVTIGQTQLEPRATEWNLPNPTRVLFDDQIELVGYDLSDMTPQAGETVELTLYWRAVRPIERDYTVFAHIIDPRTFTQVAGNDSPPVNGNAPTSTWEPGTIIEDRRALTVREDAPPDIYELEIGLYSLAPDGSTPRLRILTDDGGMADDYLYLTRVRVLPAEDGP